MSSQMSALTRVAALALFGGATLPLLSATPAEAIVVHVSGIGYDVSVITASPSSQPSAFGLPPLGQMPWWGDDALASEFATEVFAQLGSGWDSNYGPVFAYALDTPQNQVLGLTQSLTDINDQIDVTPSFNDNISYAIATSAPVPVPVAVPAPLPLFGAGAAFAYSRRLRSNSAQLRTRQHSPGVSGARGYMLLSSRDEKID